MTSNNIKNKKNIHNCNNSKSLTTTVGFFSPLSEPLPGYEKGKYDCQDLFYLTSVQLLSKPVQKSLDVQGAETGRIRLQLSYCNLLVIVQSLNALTCILLCL